MNELIRNGGINQRFLTVQDVLSETKRIVVRQSVRPEVPSLTKGRRKPFGEFRRVLSKARATNHRKNLYKTWHYLLRICVYLAILWFVICVVSCSKKDGASLNLVENVIKNACVYAIIYVMIVTVSPCFGLGNSC